MTMNISEIAVPNWHEVSQGPRGPQNGQEPCAICAQGVTTHGARTTYWVWMDSRNGDLIPFGSDGPGHDETGLQPIGQNCYKRHAEKLKGFVKRITQSEGKGGTVNTKEVVL